MKTLFPLPILARSHFCFMPTVKSTPDEKANAQGLGVHRPGTAFWPGIQFCPVLSNSNKPCHSLARPMVQTTRRPTKPINPNLLPHKAMEGYDQAKSTTRVELLSGLSHAYVSPLLFYCRRLFPRLPALPAHLTKASSNSTQGIASRRGHRALSHAARAHHPDGAGHRIRVAPKNSTHAAGPIGFPSPGPVATRVSGPAVAAAESNPPAVAAAAVVVIIATSVEPLNRASIIHHILCC
jgi:hypothetical protein